MIDIRGFFDALRATWVSRLVGTYQTNRKLIPSKFYREFGRYWLIICMNLDIKFVVKFIESIPEFYRDIQKSWIKAARVKKRFP